MFETRFLRTSESMRRTTAEHRFTGGNALNFDIRTDLNHAIVGRLSVQTL
jgi:hypothetical protein